MIYLLIYFMGYAISFLILRDYRHTYKENTWSDVVESLGFSSLSWLFLIFFFLWYIMDVNFTVFDKDPPSWL